MLLVFAATLGYRLLLFLVCVGALCTYFYGVPPPGPDIFLVAFSIALGPWLRAGYVRWQAERAFLLRKS
jgi:hypothetical protein